MNAVGAVGVDFSSFEDDSAAEMGIKLVAKKLLEHGVTGFCPTLVTGLPAYYHRVSMAYLDGIEFMAYTSCIREFVQTQHALRSLKLFKLSLA